MENKRPTAKLELDDLISWIVWFEVPGVKGGIHVPIDMCPTRSNRYKNGRYYIERWFQRHRLLITCIKKVILSLDYQPEIGYQLTLRLFNPRFHLPRSNADIEKEQKLLYPNGYPNYVRPLWQGYQKAASILNPLIDALASRLTVEIHNLEAHGLENATIQTDILETEVPFILMPVKYIGKSIRGARELLQLSMKEVGPKPFLATYIDAIRIQPIRIQKTPNWLNIALHVQNLYMFEANEACVACELMHEWQDPAITLERLMIELKVGSVQPVPTERSPKAMYLPLGLPNDMSLCIDSHVHLYHPYEIDPVFLAKSILNMKEQALGETESDPHGFILRYTKPLIDIWWDDLGIGESVSTVASGLVTGAVQGARTLRHEFKMNQDLVLTW